MKNSSMLLIAVASLGIPATAAAQEFTHFSIGIGLASRTHSAYWPGVSPGLAYQPQSGGAVPGLAASAYGSSPGPGHSGYQDYPGHGHHGGWSPFDCWDFFWYHPWDCDTYVLVGYPGFGWWDPYHAWWWTGFPGWPSFRQVRFYRFAFGPFWFGGWNWRHPHYYGARHYRSHRYAYRDHGSGYLTPGGYRSRGQAKPRSSSGDRIVRGSPLFGPRYKEDPRDRVTDNDRKRPSSRAVSRGTRTEVGNAGGRRRSGETSNTRRARPRSEAAPAPTRRTPPKLRTRTGSPSRVRSTPTRTPKPKARPATGGRSAPAVRTTPTRRATPVTRPTTGRRGAPAVRTTPTRRATPKVRPSTSRRSGGTARSAPSRTSSSKVKPAAPKRPGAKVRAPARRPPSKASAPKRSAPKARPASRRSGSSKPPPRRGGKD